MHFLIWALTVLLVSFIISFCFIKEVKSSYEKRIRIIDEDWSSELQARDKDRQDAIFKRDAEITNLTLENITLNHNNDILNKKLKETEQKYEIKTSMCIGLQKNARLWHESYDELESHIEEVRNKCSDLINAKEIEHQKEIEDLTRYYKEKIEMYTKPTEKGELANAE